MKPTTFYIAGSSPALRFAAEYLADKGRNVADIPSMDVTHLLLPVPAFDDAGRLRGGDLKEILADLPKDVTVFGGSLEQHSLAGYRTVDLLKDETYLAENAAITADCAMRIAGNNLGVVFRDCPMLVIGWGRIGKCLSVLLKSLGAEVTVAARKESDRAMAQALGFEAADIGQLSLRLLRYRVIFNTAPAPVLSETQAKHCRPDCVKIELASKPGISGSDVILARGLPGRDVPESSGRLIGKTVFRLAAKEAAL